MKLSERSPSEQNDFLHQYMLKYLSNGRGVIFVLILKMASSSMGESVYINNSGWNQ